MMSLIMRSHITLELVSDRQKTPCMHAIFFVCISIISHTYRLLMLLIIVTVIILMSYVVMINKLLIQNNIRHEKTDTPIHITVHIKLSPKISELCDSL